MALCSIRANCKTCGGPHRFQKEGVNNVLHLLLSIITFGAWIVVWILSAIWNACFVPFRCTDCGEPKFR